MSFQKCLSLSEFIKQIEDIKKQISLIEKKSRVLNDDETSLLKQNNNFSTDWKKVKICDEVQFEYIRNNIFLGDVILCSNKGSGKGPLTLPTGIYNSTIENSVIGQNVLIKDVKLIKNYYVGENVELINNGSICAQSDNTYGNGVSMSMGIETGGRDILSYAELSIDVADKIALSQNDNTLQDEYKQFIADYIEKIKFNKGIILQNCIIQNNIEIKDSFIGPDTVIKGITRLDNSTVLSNADEQVELLDGAYINDSIIQWGCEVASMGIVSSSVLTEHSHVERHGKVTDSIIGPNTGIGEGEVTASLLGPFVGFHHQALLIAAIWPEGKGNIGYGANVGSNHTSKAPDQEVFPGEGIFFGLGVNIKFPCNFRSAPYTIIATGATTLPQKMEFPFSLINSPAREFDGISPAYNEIIPAWVLSDNVYTIKRNEGKYLKRNKAKRTEFQFEVFRPEIADLMITARKKLDEVKEKKDVYLSKDIPGLGKNYLFEVNRIKAIKTYTFYIQYYAFNGLKREIINCLNQGEKKVSWTSLSQNTKNERWNHEKKILKSELKESIDIKDCMQKLIEIEEHIADDVFHSKEKDDIRGKRVIDDYESTYVQAKDDGFVKQTYADLNNVTKEIMELLKKIN